MVQRFFIILLLCFASLSAAQQIGSVGDWPDWRGPDRDGSSREKGLPEKWSLSGQTLAWKAPYGGRSTPVVLGDHLYLQNTAGKGETEQERVLCLNADSGKLIWEYKFNVYQSDVPAHRVGWASPAVDPETGNVYVFGVNNLLTALTKDGKKLWERSITEEFSPFTTHGGRTVSPMLDGNIVIVSTPTSTWGTQANRAQRFIALDKRTGEIVWVSTPGGRPYDTSYAPLNIATVNNVRLLVTGGADGAALAMKPQTGEPVWNLVVAKRALNTGILVRGKYAILSHSEENLDSNEMGMIAAFDATGKGKLGKDSIKWADRGFMGGFSSPVIDGDRIYQADNSSNLFAFDLETGREFWKQNLGTLQKASIVMGDGKIYVGTESGKFYILRPHADHCEVLSEVELPLSDQGITSQKIPEPVVASAAIARGRVYFVSSDTLYAIGPKRTPAKAWKPVTQAMEPGEGAPAWVQVAPTEMVLKPGDTVQLRARLFDAAGRFLREENSAAWSLEGLKGTVTGGKLAVAPDPVGQAGVIKVTSGGLTGEARARVIPPLPWEETFSSYAVGSVPPHWVSATAGRFQVSELDGKKVLEKLPNETLFKRMRMFMGPADWSNYTVEADIRINEKRRQMGDAGIIAQRYTLVAFGSDQRLEVNSWQPEVARAVSVPHEWKPDTWYRLKLRVENQPDGKTRIQGKAWLAAEPEPDGWLIDRIDPIPNKQGSPGLFADAQFGAYFAELRVMPNQ
ncbi:MAG TPA: PQQ-binding-like beta-propeller repeat protein [Candidatus Sulfotelmatobacter sp.]|nr:PQQ-binding-like beta-propeller repeat protein [Candidatus Sulfotelmatobacter sp.]